MITARSSANHRLAAGRMLAAAVLVCTLAVTALVACEAEAKGLPPAEVSANRADEAAGIPDARNNRTCPVRGQGQTRNAPLPCGARTAPPDHQNAAAIKTGAAPRRLATARHWERRGLLLLRWWRALFG